MSDTIFDFSARHGSTIGKQRGRRGVQTVKSVESAITAAPPADRLPPNPRQRLVDALAASITDIGYSATTVAEIVRRARTSRRTFYEYFTDREACLVALLADTNHRAVGTISAAVDPALPWEAQIRQAVEAWVANAESQPAVMLSWIRDVPALGMAARELQREVTESFITMVRTLVRHRGIAGRRYSDGVPPAGPHADRRPAGTDGGDRRKRWPDERCHRRGGRCRASHCSGRPRSG